MDTTDRRRPLVRGTIAAVVALLVALLAAGVWVAVTDDDEPAPPALDATIHFTPLDKEPDGLVQGDKTGEPVPTAAFVRIGGGTGTLADYEGKPLVVNFFASWCVPCKKEMPDIERVHRALGDRVTILGIAVRDSERDAAALVERTGVTYDVARDVGGKLFGDLGVINMPSTFFVSPQGRVVGANAGAMSEKELRSLVAEHLGVS